MGRWQQGAADIQRLIDARHLQQVTADSETPQALLAAAEAVRAQFPGVPGPASLDRLRRRRNQAEYPQPRSYDPVHPDEVDDAITVASQCLDSARRLLDVDQLGIF